MLLVEAFLADWRPSIPQTHLQAPRFTKQCSSPCLNRNVRRTLSPRGSSTRCLQFPKRTHPHSYHFKSFAATGKPAAPQTEKPAALVKPIAWHAVSESLACRLTWVDVSAGMWPQYLSSSKHRFYQKIQHFNGRKQDLPKAICEQFVIGSAEFVAPRPQHSPIECKCGTLGKQCQTTSPNSSPKKQSGAMCNYPLRL